ncbi:DUF7668 domain-containing protein [Pseudoduganella albidiflava]|uniref:DUF7668 domain-containing protein n=1 Tax=Pseudoduganella albidiflava TaxID=321983 RepID=A0AA87XTJ6_9BURK|nr:hypothetical protein [Pseudoduganella albidiflava]GGY39973.1 hypothetical protein GCM10007387_22650 [Pseudoduganella albidiflava]
MPTHPQDEDMTGQVIKDSEREGPIPSAWRPILKSIVDAFVRQDYGLLTGIPGVAPLPEQTARQIREYIEEYGATLIPLPEESWASSVCIRMKDHWDAGRSLDRGRRS